MKTGFRSLSRQFLQLGAWCLVLAGGVARAQVVAGPAFQIPPGVGTKAPAHDVRLLVVDDTPGCRFASTIQAAVDAAEDGDVILVRQGSYPRFTIDGKSVSIFGEAGAGGADVQIDSGLLVRNLQADQSVLLRGLTFRRTTSTDRLTNNAGPIWIERCTFLADGNSLSGSDAVGFFHSSVQGTGLSASLSTVFAYRASFAGKEGLDGSCVDLVPGGCGYYYFYHCAYCSTSFATGGGPAATLANAARAFLFGSTASGGVGGDGDATDCCYASPGADGPGLFASSGTESVLMDTSLVGGIYGTGLVTNLSGTVGGCSITSPVRSGSGATLTFTGPAGWNVFLTYSTSYAPAYLPERSGYSVVEPTAPTIFIGAFPVSGTLQVSMPFNLPRGVQAAVLYSQVKLYDPVSGTPYLGEPSALLVHRNPCP